jgi:hypothetical protein
LAGVTLLAVVLGAAGSPPALGLSGDCPTPGSPRAQFVPDGLNETFEQQILDFLNAGGAPERMASSIRALAIPFRSDREEYLEVDFSLLHQDLTGDETPEVALSLGFSGFYQGGYIDSRPYGLVLSCRGGMYERLGLFPFVELSQAGDLTGDGVPELLLLRQLSPSGGTLSFLQWNADRFMQLPVARPRDFGFKIVETVVSYQPGVGDVSEAWFYVPLEGLRLQDPDLDGRLELVVDRTVYRTLDSRETRSGPQRDRRELWGWDGTEIELERWEYSAPDYRFQAVQDGDDLTRFGDYAAALASYRRALSDDRLKAFQLFQTPESILLRYGAPTPTPDPAERARLAAYAQYRIMLVRVLQGDLAEAESALLSLLESHPMADPGYPYTEMAQVFWEAFAPVSDIGSGCEAAAGYAVRNANEVLIPLGSSTYGYWNREYLPEDICPFEGNQG